MIAHQLLDAYRELLIPAVPNVRWDAVNAAPERDDRASEAEAGFGFLHDAALPDDPHRAAIIGIIDDTVPFAHQRLTVTGNDEKRHSRVASVWMQGARSLTPASASDQPADPVPASLRRTLGFDRPHPPVGSDLTLGRELRGGQIDALLDALGSPALPDEAALYRAAGAIDLTRNSPPGWARAASHGAAIASLAAGFPPDDAEARRFPVIAVCLPAEVTRDTTGSLGPFFIVLAYLHILRRADRLSRFIERRRGLPANSLRLPVVINLSYGITAGPKDGQSLLERFQDALSDEDGWPGLGPVRCVLPAGNHRMSRLHARLDPPCSSAADAADVLRWILHPDDASANAVEIWGPPEPEDGGAVGRVEVALRPPGAPDFVVVPFAGDGWLALSIDGAEVARARRVRHVTRVRARDAVTLMIHPTMPRQSGDPVAPSGEWQLRVSGPTHGPIDVTLQRDESISGFRSGARQSVLRDRAYEDRSPVGLPLIDDPSPPQSLLRRRGTLNAYATGKRVVRVAGVVDPSVANAAATHAVAATAEAPDARYSGMDEDGRGGSPISAASLSGLNAAALSDERWKAPCERSIVREGLLVPGILSGSRQILSGTSLAAPQVTRILARTLADGT